MTAAKQKLSIEEYLAQEEQTQERSEYVSGEVFAMVGTTPLHNQISITCSLRCALH
jgi:Uma2 family endonuclease